MNRINGLTSEDFQIGQIRETFFHGKRRKHFRAYRKMNDTLIYVGEFTTSPKTPDKDVWKIAADAAKPS